MFMCGDLRLRTCPARGSRASFSLQWWSAAFGPQWSQPLLFSLELATLTALISAAAGAPLAFVFQRHEFSGKALVRAITLGPLIVPSLVTGIAVLQFLWLIGLARWMELPGRLIGHVVICLPFCVRTVAISDAIRRIASCRVAACDTRRARRQDLRLRAQLQ